jgi:Ca2+-binding RTX toxin-like protein
MMATINGTQFADELYGTQQADRIDGRGGDDIIEAGEGNDVVLGGLGRDALFGDDGNDQLDGGDGDDMLDGGSGADSMAGGTGNDRYFVDDAGDTVMEGAGAGIDTIHASISLTLAANIENLMLLSGSGAINGAGNGLTNRLTGNASANVLEGAGGSDIINGGDEFDTASYAGSSSAVRVNLATGMHTGGDAAGDTLISIENVTGSAFADVLTGDGGANVLSGGGGGDLLEGGSGADIVVGGDEFDTASYASSSAGVTVNLATGIHSGGDAAGDSLMSIENVTGSAFADVLTGDSSANVLSGGGGRDELYGGVGTDTLVGGIAEDWLEGGSGADIIDGGDEFDTASYAGSSAGVTVNLATGIHTGGDAAGDALISIEAVTGSAFGDVLTGNSSSNTLTGGSGNDVLDGGIGADIMAGGRGDDTYYVDNADDVVTEETDGHRGGHWNRDRVYSSVDYTLPAGSHVEELILIGSATNGTGNELSNSLYGTEFHNLLSGGAGADIMVGGAGSDGYIVDDIADVVIENAGEGHDRIDSSVDYVLPADVENLQLTSDGGSINGTGNELSNTLIGNQFSNILSGGAGDDIILGNIFGGFPPRGDTMAGGTGGDTYWVVHADDVVIENTDAGIDKIYGNITYTLADNVEELQLLNSGGVINGTGNDLDNFIGGNSANNTLDGSDGADELTGFGGDDYLFGGAGDDRLRGDDRQRGDEAHFAGLGIDVLAGGAGADVFEFWKPADSGHMGAAADQIVDFSSIEGDKIDLSKMDADTTSAGNQTFIFIDNANFTAVGQVRFSGGFVEGNVDAELGADFRIQVNAPSLVTADFIL